MANRDGNIVTLGPKDSLIGTLRVDGEVRVHGKLEGEMHASGDISVDATGRVKAQLEGQNVTIQGNVTGNVVARGKLVLAGSGILNGDVRVAKLAVEDGATLNGNVSMGAPVGGGSGSNHHEARADHGQEQAQEPDQAQEQPQGEPQPQHHG